jgi:hypothetical protein
MPLSPCTLFLMDDSSSSDDSDLDELLDDDIEQMVVLLAAKELEGRRKKQRPGSKVGRLCIPRNPALGHNMLLRDYFAGCQHI